MAPRDEAALADLFDRGAALRRECRRLLAALARTQRRIAAVRLGADRCRSGRLAAGRKPR